MATGIVITSTSTRLQFELNDYNNCLFLKKEGLSSLSFSSKPKMLFSDVGLIINSSLIECVKYVYKCDTYYITYNTGIPVFNSVEMGDINGRFY